MTAKTFTPKVISPEIRAKMEMAAAASLILLKRELRCPHDGFRVGTVFDDTGGHVMFKCQKCKTETVYNLTPGTDLDFRRVSG